MLPNGKLATWLKKGRNGKCPCGQPVRTERSKLCAQVECRQEYHRLYHLDRTTTALREVKRVSKPKDGKVILTLSCKHKLTVPVYRAESAERRRCPTCSPATQPAS